MSERTRRYMLPGPCAAWAVEGRDGWWYRVCVPCDVAPPSYGGHPGHLMRGYRLERDAAMSARDHARAMDANRAQVARNLARQERIMAAALAGDFLTFGREIMRDPRWVPAPDRNEAELREILADYVARGH